MNFFYKDGGVQRAVGSGAVRFAIFGLTISSAWANGHATPWRGLLKALHAAGHHATFFERDVTYYAAHRDLPRPAFCDLVLFAGWPDGLRAGARHAAATACLLRPGYADYSRGPNRAWRGHTKGARYLTPELIPEFDLYLSFTGGPLLDRLQTDWGARRVAALYGPVDPSVDRLLLEPARRRPADSFWVVGSLYPDSLHWPPNVTRQAMRRWGFTPSRSPLRTRISFEVLLDDGASVSWENVDGSFFHFRTLTLSPHVESIVGGDDLQLRSSRKHR